MDKYQGDKDVLIGAGTVLDAITARIAILEGAQFIVSPSFDLETVKLCNKYRVASMPGTSTMAGVLEALEAGADVIKLFPARCWVVKMVKIAVKGPVPQAQMPTGGVRETTWANGWGLYRRRFGGRLTGPAKKAIMPA